MNTNPVLPIRAGVVIAGLLAWSLVTPAAATAQTGTGWSALLGCWRPDPVDLFETSGATSEDRVICITPGDNARNVQLVTVVDGSVASRESVDGSGSEHSFDRDGCLGVESSWISDDGRRIHQRSEYSCPGPFSRKTSGILTLLPTGEWLNVQGVSAGEYTEVQVVRHTAVSDVASVDPGIARSLAGQEMMIRAARSTARAPVTIDEVIEASREASPEVVEAWLIETEQNFHVTARQLVTLADAGVPEGVIDIVVALSNPSVFAIDLTSREGEFRAQPESAPASRGGYYDPWMDRYGRRGRYGPYGRPGYGGYYYPRPPVVIVLPPSPGEAPPRTRIVRGEGYTQDQPSSASPTSEPASDATSRGTPAAPGSGGRRANPGNQGSGNSSPSGSRGATTPTTPERTGDNDTSSSTPRTARPRAQ
ncbi:MAG: hypothetical protein LBG44_00400 [Gemmatimonadota bacterium]|jgi:hypothetical protein|nr:hypothetical protein [Gemmatimonadota bacterium]